MINSFDEFFDSVAMFNEIAGNLARKESSAEAFKAIGNQFERVEEEAREGVEGGVSGSLEQLVDAAVDSLVTAFGAIQMLAVNFPDVKLPLAINLICQNNLSKFIPNITVDEANANISFYAERGEEVVVKTVKLGGTTYGVIRRARDNKIMKPRDYQPVDLKECL